MTAKGLFGVILVSGLIGYAYGYTRARERFLEVLAKSSLEGMASMLKKKVEEEAE